MTQETVTKRLRWLSGFFDSDGTIHLKVQKKENSYYINPAMKITQRGPEYIAGMVDGDGEISSLISQVDDHKMDYRIQPHFKVVQTGNSMWNVMKVLESFSERNNISYSTREIKHGNDDWNDGFSFTITEVESSIKFLNSINDYLVVKRKQANIMLNEILPRMKQEVHKNKQGFLEIMHWRDVMNSYKGGQRGKYNLEYFEDEWNIEIDGSDIENKSVFDY